MALFLWHCSQGRGVETYTEYLQPRDVSEIQYCAELICAWEALHMFAALDYFTDMAFRDDSSLNLDISTLSDAAVDIHNRTSTAQSVDRRNVKVGDLSSMQ